jgi:hypothetical protein
MILEIFCLSAFTKFFNWKQFRSELFSFQKFVTFAIRSVLLTGIFQPPLQWLEWANPTFAKAMVDKMLLPYHLR